MLGQCSRDLGMPEKAAACFAEAIRYAPTDGATATSHVYALLLTGRLGEGWQEYERSRQAGRSRGAHWWDGESIAGHLQLTNEGGHGDAFMLVRWLPRVRERVGALTLEVHPSLVRLLQPQFAGVRVVPIVAERRRFDRGALLGSLPALCGLAHPEEIPPAPYLESRQPFRRLPSGPGHLRVGLVWAGSGKIRPERRTIGLGAFAPVLVLEGVTFYSLQVGAGAAEVSQFPARIHDLSGELTDWARTAAVLAHLDLLITCDSGIAHLAGALGRPVWICLPTAADWRWLLDRSDTPWYGSARLFRQRRDGVGDALRGGGRGAQRACPGERGLPILRPI
jgi:hypothetical protein